MENIKNSFIFLSVFVLLTVSLGLRIAKDSPLNEIEYDIKSFVEDTIAKYNIPGVITEVKSPEATLNIGVTDGYADLASKREPLLTDSFKIGSITKTFTSAGILLLLENSKLSLDDTLSTHYKPAFTIPNAEKITIRHLLQHTSGIADYFSKGFIEFLRFPEKHYTPEELILSGIDISPLFEPGEGFSYSNTGYLILGRIIENLSGMSYKDYIHNEFISKYELTSTFVPDNDTKMPESAMRGYVNLLNEQELIDFTDNSHSIAWAAGNIVSNSEDLHKWMSLLYGGQIFQEQIMIELFKTVKLPYSNLQYGLGVLVLDNGMVGHNGLVPGYTTSALYHTKTQISITFFYNKSPLPPSVAPSGYLLLANDVFNLIQRQFGKHNPNGMSQYFSPDYFYQINSSQLMFFLNPFFLEAFPLEIEGISMTTKRPLNLQTTISDLKLTSYSYIPPSLPSEKSALSYEADTKIVTYSLETTPSLFTIEISFKYNSKLNPFELFFGECVINLEPGTILLKQTLGENISTLNSEIEVKSFNLNQDSILCSGFGLNKGLAEIFITIIEESEEFKDVLNKKLSEWYNLFTKNMLTPWPAEIDDKKSHIILNNQPGSVTFYGTEKHQYVVSHYHTFVFPFFQHNTGLQPTRRSLDTSHKNALVVEKKETDRNYWGCLKLSVGLIHDYMLVLAQNGFYDYLIQDDRFTVAYFGSYVPSLNDKFPSDMILDIKTTTADIYFHYAEEKLKVVYSAQFLQKDSENIIFTGEIDLEAEAVLAITSIGEDDQEIEVRITSTNPKITGFKAELSPKHEFMEIPFLENHFHEYFHENETLLGDTLNLPRIPDKLFNIYLEELHAFDLPLICYEERE